MDAQRWERLCKHLGISSQSALEKEFKHISAAYGEPHRAYHTVQHINECLELLDWASAQVPDFVSHYPALEIALWYHDMVYLPQGSNNERRSADRAVAFLQANGVTQTQVRLVESLIMATCHLIESKPDEGTELTHWMVDIDLAILGASPQRFIQYDKQIRQEYDWVAPTEYRTRRQKALAQFLRRPVIYQSALFRDRFEAKARENLEAMVSAYKFSSP